MPFQFRKEAIEEDLNTNFPSQGQGNPPLYYSLSEVVVPTYSINSTAEGSGLPQNLQTAWDFSTSQVGANGTTQTIANTAGFWQVGVSVSADTATTGVVRIAISDGISSKNIWEYTVSIASGGFAETNVYYLRSGDTLSLTSTQTGVFAEAWTRQIATSTGQLVNPLGFSFA